jgi:hypothetical protein
MARAWPWSGLLVLAYGSLVVGALVRGWVRKREDRGRIGGLAALFCAGALLGLATGQFRGSPGTAGALERRYVPLAALWWCPGVFVWALYAPPALGRGAASILAAIAACLLPANWSFLRAKGLHDREVTDTLAGDIAQGISFDDLIRRYPNCIGFKPDEMRSKLDLMRDVGLWPRIVAWADSRAHGPARDRISPQRIEPADGVGYRWIGEEFALVGPPGHVLEFSVDAGRRELVGRFGIPKPSHALLASESVRFVIERIQPGGRVEQLFARELRPGVRAWDGVVQEFGLALPEGNEPSTIILRTEGPTAPLQGTVWVYWAGLRAR